MSQSSQQSTINHSTSDVPAPRSEDHPVLLAVLAHPDDETFGIGGTLAYYSRRGVDTYLVCATRGEAGEVDPSMLQGYPSIAERREAELRCASGKLGLHGVFFLDYRDSGMAGSPDNNHPLALVAQPVKQVAEEIACTIRRLKPDVVITFDPIGGYRHPDHIFIHQATVRALDLAADPSHDGLGDLSPFTPRKLYYQTIPRGFMRFIVRFMRLTGRDPRKYGRNRDIDLAAIAEVDFPINAVINYHAVADIRDEASACHASQLSASLTGGIFSLIRRLFAARELFMRAVPPPDGKVEHDLFAGIAHLPPLRR